jgi:hypothetical protein
MIQGVNRLVIFLQRLSCAVLALGHNLGQLFSKSLIFSEFVQNWFMKKVLNVLVVVEGSRSSRTFISLLLVSGISRIYTLQNTQTSRMEVRNGDNQ